MSGERERPWQAPVRQAVTDTAIEVAGRAAVHAGDALAQPALRAAIGAAQDRSLDILRGGHLPGAEWYEPPPWRQLPVSRAPPLEAPVGLRATGMSAASRFATPAYGLRAAAPALRLVSTAARGIGRALGYTIGGIPVVGIGVEMLHSSPLADGTLRAAGRQMLEDQRAGRDPFRSYRMMTPLDYRRATTFMALGLNPLDPGYSPEGRRYVYSEDLRPDAPVGQRHVVFPPDYVHLSPEIIPASRARPWTAAPGGFGQFGL